MDHPRGEYGDLADGLRGVDRERLEEVTGITHANTDRTLRRRMSDFTTDQAERESTGGHPYGRYLEEFEVGDVYKHWPAKTVTESDDHLFCLITMNHHPLHLNDVYAKASQQGRNVVVGPLVYSLALGMSVSDVSGKAIANLATEELKHPAPVFHGDTLFVESEVLEKRESQSKPDRGTVKVHTRVFNQDGTLVAEFKRLVLVPRKTAGPPVHS
jgi:acyl dehydratase